MKITTAQQERLICPRCRSRLYPRGESFICKNCGNDYPVIAGIPILIDESVSGFRISTYERPKPRSHAERAKRALRSALPAISMNLSARRNYRHFREMLLAVNPQPRVLIIGGATHHARLRRSRAALCRSDFRRRSLSGGDFLSAG